MCACIASTLEEIAKASGFVTRREVPVGGKERPGDVEVVSWQDGRSALVDLTVVHSLNAS